MHGLLEKVWWPACVLLLQNPPLPQAACKRTFGMKQSVNATFLTLQNKNSNLACFNCINPCTGTPERARLCFLLLRRQTGSDLITPKEGFPVLQQDFDDATQALKAAWQTRGERSPGHKGFPSQGNSTQVDDTIAYCWMKPKLICSPALGFAKRPYCL